MGRPKTYDRTEIAEKAMQLFWLHGFEGTSTQLLVDELGINRGSLYAEFGSKQCLFEAALTLYDERVVAHHFARIEGPEAGLCDIRAMLEFFASKGHAPGSERGCLLCNVATERAPHDPGSRGFVQAYVDRIEAALANALHLDHGRGLLREDMVIADEARYVTSTLLGFFVLMRSQVDPALLAGAGRAAVRYVDTLLTSAPIDRQPV